MGLQNYEYPFEVMFIGQVNARFGRGSCFFDCSFYNACFTVIFICCCFYAIVSFLTGQKGSRIFITLLSMVS